MYTINFIYSLPQCPETQSIALALDIEPDRVTGGVVRLLARYRDTSCSLMTASQLDDLMGLTGFAAALSAVGWLIIHANDATYPRGALRDEVIRMHHTRGAAKVRALRKSTAPAAPIEPEPVVPALLMPAPEPEPVRQKYVRPVAVIPDWIPSETWEAFLDMRVKVKRPMTEYAKKLAVMRLAQLRIEGEDPRVVIEQSILNGWQGIFTTKKHDFPGRGGKPTPVTDYSKLDYESGATREEDYPDWLKKEG